MTEPRIYADNVLVRRSKDSCDFLAVWFKDGNVALSRYFVPGRCDIYGFDKWEGENHIRCGTDVGTPMAKSVRMLKHDLDRPWVVKMLTKAATRRDWMASGRRLADLVAQFGDTKSHRSIRAARKRPFND